MKRFYGKLWNELCNNGEQEIEKELRNEMSMENIGLIKWKGAGMKKQEMCQLGNLRIEILKFGGSERKAHMSELFNNTVDKNHIPKECQTG